MSEVPEEEPEGPTSEDPPEEYEPEEVEEGTYGDDVGTADADERALVLKDCNPWMTTANEDVLGGRGVTYDVRNSESLPNIDLDEYGVVVVPSGQSQSYVDQLVEEKEKLAAYVESGGTLVAHAAFSAWACSADWETSYLPGGVMPVRVSGFFENNALERLDSGHPVVSGLSDDDLSFWWSSTQGYLTGLPDRATRVVGIQGDEARPTYVEYTYGNGVVLATMQTIEWPWQSSWGTRRLLRNDLAYAFEHDHGGPDRVSASVTTLQFIPGEEENPSRGGHPLNSGLMQIIPGEGGEISIPWTDTSVGMYPMFDSWIGGDMRDDIPETLEEARKPKDAKYIDDAGTEPFNEYRFENGVNVSFETTEDSSVDKDTIEVQFNESGPSGDDPLIARGDQENSRTVLHDHEVNTIPWRDWYDEESVKSSRRQPRYYEYDTDFEFEGVEGVRVFTVWGGWAAFMDDLSDRVSENAATFFSELWGWPVPETLAKAALAAAPVEVQFAIDSMAVVPNTYSVLDLIVLADGRRYVRIWDASEYPSLATYVDGDLQKLEEMPYEPRELFNRDMFAFTVHAMAGVTPYQSLALRYFKSHLRNHPAIRNDLEETLIEFVRLLDLPWGAHELMPSIPRETLAFDATGEPLDDADAPFGTGVIMKPWSRLESR